MYLDILMRRWRIAASVAFAVICLGALGSMLISPKYQAGATLRMETPIGGSSSGTNYETTFANRLTNTYAQIATSEQLMSELKKKLGIKVLPDIQVTLIPDSEIIQILVESSSPAQAAKTANTLAEMLVSYQDNSVSSVDSKELNLLEDRVELLKSELAGYQQKHDQMAQSYSEITAEMSVLDRKIKLKEGADQNLVTEYELIVANVAGFTGGATAKQRDTLATGIEDLEKELDSLHLQFKDLSVKASNYLQQITLLRLSIQSAQSTYSNLLGQYDAVQLAHLRQVNAQKIIIVSPAVEPVRPSGPGRILIIGLGVLCGPIAGVIMAFLVDNLDTRIFSFDQIEHVTSAPVIGSISKFHYSQTGELPDKKDLKARRDYWILRARLQKLIEDGAIRNIMLTSPNRLEGKSTIVCKLASGLARYHLKVLVVDADLHQPKQHILFNAVCEHGLSEFLNGESDDLKSMICKNVVPGVDLLPNLVECDDPTELLQSSRLKTLFESFEKYDVVLFDTPAFLAVPDVLELAKNVEGVIVVTRWGYTTSGDIQSVCDHLESLDTKILGLVVNQSPSRKVTDSYYPKTGRSYRQSKKTVADPL